MNKERRPAGPDVGGHRPPYASTKHRGNDSGESLKRAIKQVGRAVPDGVHGTPFFVP
jgi:hypothetical protein